MRCCITECCLNIQNKSQLNKHEQYVSTLFSSASLCEAFWISFLLNVKLGAAKVGKFFLMKSLRYIETSALDHTLTNPHTRNPQLHRCENVLCLKGLTLGLLLLLRKAVLRDDMEHFCCGTARRLAETSGRRLPEWCHPTKLKFVYIFQNSFWTSRRELAVVYRPTP